MLLYAEEESNAANRARSPGLLSQQTQRSGDYPAETRSNVASPRIDSRPEFTRGRSVEAIVSSKYSDHHRKRDNMIRPNHVVCHTPGQTLRCTHHHEADCATQNPNTRSENPSTSSGSTNPDHERPACTHLMILVGCTRSTTICRLIPAFTLYTSWGIRTTTRGRCSRAARSGMRELNSEHGSPWPTVLEEDLSRPAH